MRKEFQRKLQAALQELSETGMWSANYNPLASMIFRFIGFRVRPPHYMSARGIFLYMMAWFAPLFGYVMYMWQWRWMGVSVWMAIIIALFAGALFGAAMAWVITRDRRKHKLSDWDDL
jgi:hypothetical protein